MSRTAQSKSRAEKKGGQSAPTPAVTHEIVPGKYTDVDWNRMLEFDDGDEFIGELVDEVVDKTLNIIYDKYIERQLLPYTISQAKEALLTIIDWRFLTCDDGEADPSSDPTWQEDEEPTAPIPDCWAQGSVPQTIIKKPATPVSGLISEPVEPVIAEEKEPDAELEEQEQQWVPADDSFLKDDNYVEVAPTPEPVEKTEKVPIPPSSENKRKQKRFRPHKGKLPPAGVREMGESLDLGEKRLSMEKSMKMAEQQSEETSRAPFFNTMPKSVGSILKFQSGRPPGNRDVYYDDQGNVVAMSKINPEKLPTHRIKTKYYVVDPAVEAAQARLDAMRTGRYLGARSKKQSMPMTDKTKLEKSSILDYRSLHSESAVYKSKHSVVASTKNAQDPMTPLPPPMIESMELVPGVVVREGDRVKRGPRQLQRTADRLPSKELLRPVGADADLGIAVKDLLGNRSPMVRIEATPVPPIMNKQKIST